MNAQWLQYLGPLGPYVFAFVVILGAIGLALKGIATYGSQILAVVTKGYRFFFRISEEFEEALEREGKRIDAHDKLHAEHGSRFDDHSEKIRELAGDQAEIRAHVERLDDRLDQQLADQGDKLDLILEAVTA